MIQLSFQAAFDSHHAVFRILRLVEILRNQRALHRDFVRILDFYLLFPFRIDSIRLLPEHRKFKKLSASYAWTKPYGNQPEDQTVFNRMEPMQLAALDTLDARGLIDPGQFNLNMVRIGDQLVPTEIAERISYSNERDASLVEFLIAVVSNYELNGVNGLKARTGLLEYRYDPV